MGVLSVEEWMVGRPFDLGSGTAKGQGPREDAQGPRHIIIAVKMLRPGW